MLTSILYALTQGAQKSVADVGKLTEVCADTPDAPKVLLKAKRVLKGHLSKVNCVHYGDDSR